MENQPRRLPPWCHFLSCLACSYQVFSQPVFMSAERLLCLWFPNSVSRMNKRTLSIIFRSACKHAVG